MGSSLSTVTGVAQPKSTTCKINRKGNDKVSSRAAARSIRRANVTAWDSEGGVTAASTITNASTTINDSLCMVSEELREDKDTAVMSCHQQNGIQALRDASTKLRNDKGVVSLACTQNGLALRFASSKLRNDKDVVSLACTQNGIALHFASPNLRNDRDVVLVACNENGDALYSASSELRDEKDIALVACQQNGLSLRYVSTRLRKDKDVVLAACHQTCRAIQFASDDLQSDPDIVQAATYGSDSSRISLARKSSLEMLATEQDEQEDYDDDNSQAQGRYSTIRDAKGRNDDYVELFCSDKGAMTIACSHDWRVLEFASKELQNDEDVVMAACLRGGLALQYASMQLKGNKEVVITACCQNWRAIRYVAKQLYDDEEVRSTISKAITRYRPSSALLEVPDELRRDKDIVLAAITADPDCLKFAADELKHDPDCLVAATLWDKSHAIKHKMQKRTSAFPLPKVVLSTRFSLSSQSTSRATKFTVELKRHPYIQLNFSVYSPNAYSKQTCDPAWTNFEHPCRGTFETCTINDDSFKIGVPQSNSCWRYSFRYQLDDAKQTNGFMVQVVDYDMKFGVPVLGQGQEIEADMAREVGVKVFRLYQPGSFNRSREYDYRDIKRLVSSIRRWYEGDCLDMSEVEIRLCLSRK